MSDLRLRILWDFVTLTEESLKDIKEDEFILNATTTNENKIIFTKKDFSSRFTKHALICLTAIFIFYLILDNSSISARFGSVLLISFFVLILGTLFSLYQMPKSIIFYMDKRYFVNIIMKRNFLGIGIKLLDLEYPEKVNRLVISKGLEKSYITFRTENGDNIPKKSPIIVIYNEDNQSSEMLTLITEFVENAGHEIAITNLQLLK